MKFLLAAIPLALSGCGDDSSSSDSSSATCSASDPCCVASSDGKNSVFYSVASSKLTLTKVTCGGSAATAAQLTAANALSFSTYADCAAVKTWLTTGDGLLGACAAVKGGSLTGTSCTGTGYTASVLGGYLTSFSCTGAAALNLTKWNMDNTAGAVTCANIPTFSTLVANGTQVAKTSSVCPVALGCAEKAYTGENKYTVTFKNGTATALLCGTTDKTARLPAAVTGASANFTTCSALQTEIEKTAYDVLCEGPCYYSDGASSSVLYTITSTKPVATTVTCKGTALDAAKLANVNTYLQTVSTKADCAAYKTALTTDGMVAVCANSESTSTSCTPDVAGEFDLTIKANFISAFTCGGTAKTPIQLQDYNKLLSGTVTCASLLTTSTIFTNSAPTGTLPPCRISQQCTANSVHTSSPSNTFTIWLNAGVVTKLTTSATGTTDKVSKLTAAQKGTTAAFPSCTEAIAAVAGSTWATIIAA